MRKITGTRLDEPVRTGRIRIVLEGPYIEPVGFECFIADLNKEFLEKISARLAKYTVRGISIEFCQNGELFGFSDSAYHGLLLISEIRVTIAGAARQSVLNGKVKTQQTLAEIYSKAYQ